MKRNYKKLSFSFAAVALIISSFTIFGDACRPFFISFILSYLMIPTVNFFEKKRVPRSVTSGLFVALIFTIIIAVIGVLIPFVSTRFSIFIQDFLIIKADSISNHDLSKLEKLTGIEVATLQKFIEKIKLLTIKLTNEYTWHPKSAINSLVKIFATIFVIPIIMFYMLKDWKKIGDSFFSIIPNDKRSTYRYLSMQIDRSILTFIRAQVNVSIFFGLYYAICFWILSLKMGFLLGLMMGVFIFIPYVGFPIGCTIVTIISFLQFGISNYFYTTCGIFVNGQLLDANFVTPKFIGDKVGIHPAFIVFGLFACTSLFGINGAILALPITVTSSVVIKYAISKYKTSQYFYS